MAKAKKKQRAPANDEPLVNPFAAQHGDYREATVVDLTGELGGRRNSMVKVKLNRGGTAIERWMNEPEPTLFGEAEKSAIRYCQMLWARIDCKQAFAAGRPIGQGPEGLAEHEAMSELALFRRRLPHKYYDAFENIARFRMDAPLAGSKLANSSRSAGDAAKLATAFVAGMIAQWRG